MGVGAYNGVTDAFRFCRAVTVITWIISIFSMAGSQAGEKEEVKKFFHEQNLWVRGMGE